jgi:hypothetical protein
LDEIKTPIGLFGVHTYKLYKEASTYRCNPPMAIQTFFQVTIPYVSTSSTVKEQLLNKINPKVDF